MNPAFISSFLPAMPFSSTFITQSANITPLHRRSRAPQQNKYSSLITAQQESSHEASTPSTNSSSSAAQEEYPDTPFSRKYGHLRGKDVKTVSATIQVFVEKYGRPVPSVYRTLVNETLVSTHLTLVCAMFRMDPIFAHGFVATFKEFFGYYPSDEDKKNLYESMVAALDLDVGKLQADSDLVVEFCKRYNGDQELLFQAIRGEVEDNSQVMTALRYIRNAPWYDWYYSRNFGLGVLKMIELIGEKITRENVLKWAEQLKISTVKLESEMDVYLSSIERLKQAEQLFAEMAAREKRKLAERLERKAELARKEAEESEKEGALSSQ